MGVFDAPAWVVAAWRRSLQDVGATADQPTLEAYGERMIERWSAPERAHHNLKRLIAVLARVDELAPETHDPDVVRLAAWYHGAAFDATAQNTYAHRGGVDEAASAELARTELAELGVPAEVVERIAALILGIARHSAPKDDIDAQALCDADLGILAAEPQRYAAYRKQVREEYAHIPQADYVRARLAIVTKLLSRPHLFQSPMAQDWEDAARENLTAELDRLTAQLAQLPEEPADEAGAGEAAGPVDAQDAHDGAAAPGEGTSPGHEGAQDAHDGAAPVSADSSPAVPEEVHLPDGGPGPAGFEPVEVEEPGAADDAAESVRRISGRERETIAQRSQRRWAEHLAAQEASGRGTPVRRRDASAPSPLEPGVGDTGPNEGVEGDTEDFDETSSLSRPPKMPAIKHRPREGD
ncbi:HD domain-containing protein [Ruania albidiflava]|uniref:HD domain-containing protein n=1 Tax=Ruania albidiflava TaxID=366586 RepID=UPI0003B3627D|nr:hypothetical protein [Ruania albidiflava]